METRRDHPSSPRRQTFSPPCLLRHAILVDVASSATDNFAEQIATKLLDQDTSTAGLHTCNRMQSLEASLRTVEQGATLDCLQSYTKGHILTTPYTGPAES